MIDSTIKSKPVTKLAANRETRGWQQVIWREWRYSEDETYGRHLFDLVAKAPASRRVRVVISVLGLLFGLQAGLLIDLLFFPTVMPLAAWIGSVGGGFWGIWLGGQISMSRWLVALTPNNIFPRIGWPFKLLLLVMIFAVSIYFIPSIWIAGLVLGISSGLFLGLVLGLLTWPLLGLISLTFLQGQLLTSPDLIAGWASAGAGVGLGVLLAPGWNLNYVYPYRSLFFWWKEQPYRAEVVQALQYFCQLYPQAAATWKDLLPYLGHDSIPQGSPEIHLARLSSTSWEKRFIARQALITLSSEAIETILLIARGTTSPLQQTGLWLLRNIERETTRWPNPVCSRCMLRCKDYLISSLPDTSFFYRGCRGCGQSQEFLNGEIIAILDTEMEQDWLQEGGQIRVNWLARRTLFDFDRVEIIQAGDEVVERFAVQVGNDTDALRRSRYTEMVCAISPDCSLSENSIRVLKRIFGRVDQVPADAIKES
jgi:hypothetical protein